MQFYQIAFWSPTLYQWSYNNGFQNRLTIKKAIGLFFLRLVSKNIDRFCPWNMILDSQTDFTQLWGGWKMHFSCTFCHSEHLISIFPFHLASRPLSFLVKKDMVNISLWVKIPFTSNIMKIWGQMCPLICFTSKRLLQKCCWRSISATHFLLLEEFCCQLPKFNSNRGKYWT